MAVRFRKLELIECWNLAWPFFALLGLGIVGRVIVHFRWQDVIAALSDALMVAGALGVAFEIFATRFLIERVAGDLSEKLIGQGLPKELQGHIRRIVNTDIVREHYVKCYSFSEPIGGKVKLDVTVTFQVRNYSESTKPYLPAMDEEGFFLPVFSYLEYGIAGEVPYSFNADQLSKLSKSDPKSGLKSVAGKEIINLESIHENRKAICAVTWKYSVTMPEEFSESTDFCNATIGVRLRIDRKPDGLKFLSESGTNVIHAEGSHSWDFTGTFIAGQHIRTWWFRNQI